MRTLLHAPHSRRRSITAATLGALALIGSLLVATPAQALSDTGTGGVFVPASGRVLDTKNNIGGYSTPMPAKTWRTVKVTGVAGLPDDGSVGAVSVVATTADITAQGQLFGRPNPDETQTLMGIYGGKDRQNTSFSSVLAVNSDGTIQVYAETSARLILDVQGYYTANTDGTAPGGFVPLNGKRVADSRYGTGIPKSSIVSTSSVTLQVTGTAGVPAGASSVIVNLIALNKTSSVGYLTPYATGATRPSNSFNYAGDVITTMQAQVKLSADGKITIYNANSTIDLAIDVQGYFTAAGKSGAMFTPGNGKITDTRATGNTALAGDETRAFDVAWKSGVPVMGSGINAVVLTLTSFATNGGGWGRVWANGTTEPDTASLRYEDGTIRTNTVTVPIGANGRINLHNIGTGATNFVIDVQGWYANPKAPTITCAAIAPGTWNTSPTDTNTDTDVNCNLTAGPAVNSEQVLRLYVNDIPSAEFALDDASSNTFPYTLEGASGRITLVARVEDGTTDGPSTSYQFGIGDWVSDGLVPSIADGSIVASDDAAIAALSPRTGLLPADADVTYQVTDETTGTTTASRVIGYGPASGVQFTQGHDYSWNAKVAALNSWRVATVYTPQWRFHVAAEGEEVPSTEPTEDSPPPASQAKVTVNGCTGVPQSWGKANFKPVCNNHDRCYQSRSDRLTCDNAFIVGLTAVCVKAYPKGAKRVGCAAIAQGYYQGVRTLGSYFYKGSGKNN